MEAYEFDAVKAKKSRALRRYRRNHRLKTLMRMPEIFVALLLLSYYYSSAISLAIELARDSLRQFVCLLTKPLSVFLLSNAIIATVVVLSCKDGNHSSPTPGIYDEYVARRRVSSSGNSQATENSDLDKQIVPYHSPSSPSPDDNIPRTTVPEPEVPNHALFETVEAVTETDRVVVVKAVERPTIFPPVRGIEVVAVTGASTSNSKRKQCWRTQSTAAARETKSQRERRLTVAASDNGGKMVAPPVRSSQRSLEDLSNEEFNLTVEKCIARRRRCWEEEKMAEATSNAMEESHKAIGYHSVQVKESD